MRTNTAVKPTADIVEIKIVEGQIQPSNELCSPRHWGNAHGKRKSFRVP